MCAATLATVNLAFECAQQHGRQYQPIVGRSNMRGNPDSVRRTAFVNGHSNVVRQPGCPLPDFANGHSNVCGYPDARYQSILGVRMCAANRMSVPSRYTCAFECVRSNFGRVY